MLNTSDGEKMSSKDVPVTYEELDGPLVCVAHWCVASEHQGRHLKNLITSEEACNAL